MANETFEKLLQVFESSASNASIRISDARRAVLIEALRIAIDSGAAVDALRPRTAEPKPFNLNQLNFSERTLVKQLREGAKLKVHVTNFTKFPYANPILHGLVATTALEGEDDDLMLLTITARGLAAR